MNLDDARVKKSSDACVAAINAAYKAAAERRTSDAGVKQPTQEEIAELCADEFGPSIRTFKRHIGDDTSPAAAALAAAKSAWAAAAPSRPTVKDTKHYEDTIDSLRASIAVMSRDLDHTRTKLAETQTKLKEAQAELKKERQS